MKTILLILFSISCFGQKPLSKKDSSKIYLIMPYNQVPKWYRDSMDKIYLKQNFKIIRSFGCEKCMLAGNKIFFLTQYAHFLNAQ